MKPDNDIYEKENLLESNGLSPTNATRRYASRLRSCFGFLPRTNIARLGIALISLTCLAILFARVSNSPAAVRWRLSPAPITVQSASGLHLVLNDKFLNTLSHNSATCDAAFPRLYEAAIKTAQYYRRRGGMTQAHLDDAQADDPNARVVLKDGRLYIKHYRPGYQSRVMAVLLGLHSAVSGFHQSS